MDGESYFSDDYRLAARRFRNAARAAGAELSRLHLGLRGALGEKLSIDVALFGNRKAKKLLLHSSGVHGVEGFAGSAIQLKLLENPPDPGKDGAIAVVHCVNPYGMSQLRRVNEDNVDLNRNFMKRGSHGQSGAHEGYHILHPLLNPERRSRFDLFTLPLLMRILRHGANYLKQAGGQGQYLYPRGLFFGGHDLQQGPQLLMEWMRRNFTRAKRIVGIDVHTGVGEPGEDWLIVDRNAGGAYHNMLRDRYGLKRVDAPDDEDRKAYSNLGGLDAGIVRAARKLGGCLVDFVTQEFGTTGGRSLLRALREENRATHFDDAEFDHPARQALKDSFAPREARWRRDVVNNGVRLAEISAGHLFARGA